MKALSPEQLIRQQRAELEKLQRERDALAARADAQSEMITCLQQMQVRVVEEVEASYEPRSLRDMERRTLREITGAALEMPLIGQRENLLHTNMIIRDMVKSGDLPFIQLEKEQEAA